MEQFNKPFKDALKGEIDKLSYLCASILREYGKEHGKMNGYQVRSVIWEHIQALESKTREIEGAEEARKTDVITRVMRDFYLGIITNLANGE